MTLIHLNDITVNDVDEIHPSVSPDNSSIVFTEGNQASNKTKDNSNEFIYRDKN